MREALRALRRSGSFSVKSWAHAIGKSRHALRRLCVETLHCTPEEIAWAFFDARVRRAVLQGRSDAEIVIALGIANPYVLHRAYARRGLPFPTR